MLEPGLEETVQETITPEMSAASLGSGDVQVLGTPSLLALVERVAVAAVVGSLDPGRTTVGASVELHHLAPTPVGALVTVTVRLEGVEGRKLRFSFEASDPGGIVARGTHLRVVVERDGFIAEAARRSGDQPR